MSNFLLFIELLVVTEIIQIMYYFEMLQQWAKALHCTSARLHQNYLDK